MSVKAKYQNEEWLREQYVNQQQSGYEIAQECGCSANTVYAWLDRHGIETRSEGTDAKRRVTDQRIIDSDWVHEQYVEQHKSVREIAEECGCSFTAARRWIHRHGIETRADHQRAPDRRLTDPSWLRNQYEEDSRHCHEIAEECGCSETAVREWLNRHGIETRGSADFTGEDHPRWNGGVVDYGAGWNGRKRRAVRERDDHNCQNPGCSVTQSEHLDEYDEKLHVHHLQKARDVDYPEKRNAKENLITLCRDCHRRWEKIADAGLVPEVESR